MRSSDVYPVFIWMGNEEMTPESFSRANHQVYWVMSFRKLRIIYLRMLFDIWTAGFMRHYRPVLTPKGNMECINIDFDYNWYTTLFGIIFCICLYTVIHRLVRLMCTLVTIKINFQLLCLNWKMFYRTNRILCMLYSNYGK